MIVGLVKPVSDSGAWHGFEDHYARYLAQKLATGPHGRILELDVQKQIGAGSMLLSTRRYARQGDNPKRGQLGEGFLNSCQIFDFCSSDILVLDLAIRDEADLKCLARWCKAICELSKLAANSDQCPCGALHGTKSTYAMVTIGQTDEADERQDVREKIETRLSRIGLTDINFFFRSFTQLMKNPLATDAKIATGVDR